MIITTFATFTIRPGKTAGAMKLIRAVKRQAQAEQPGTLVYLVHRVLTKSGRPTRQLYFYERYRSQGALNKHLASRSWKAVVKQWPNFFEGRSSSSLKFFGAHRIAAFERRGAIPVRKARRA